MNKIKDLLRDVRNNNFKTPKGTDMNQLVQEGNVNLLQIILLI